MSWQPYLFYAFPPFSLITRVLQKIREEKATGLVLVPKWPAQPWWPKLMQMLIQLPVQLPKNSDTLFSPSNPQELHPLHKKLCLILCHLSGDTSMAKAFRQQLPPSWNNPGGQARKQYATYLQKWQYYCSSRDIDSLHPSVEDGINFLAELYDAGIGYSAINTARSALSSVFTLPNTTTFGAHPMVCRFLKGVFQLKPSLPKYRNIWDVNTVLTYLSSLHPPQDLTLKGLTLKTTMLLALLSGQRCQTLHFLSVSSMVMKLDTCVFTIHKLLKTSRPGKHVTNLTFTAYSPDNHLCPIVCLSEYVKRTSKLRTGSDQLLVSIQKPHKPVSTHMILRWLKTVL